MLICLRIIDDDYYPNEEEVKGNEGVEENMVNVNEGVDVYEARNAHIQAVCNKYQLYSSENQSNEYQEIKRSYKPPIQVDEYN